LHESPKTNNKKKRANAAEGQKLFKAEQKKENQNGFYRLLFEKNCLKAHYRNRKKKLGHPLVLEKKRKTISSNKCSSAKHDFEQKSTQEKKKSVQKQEETIQK